MHLDACGRVVNLRNGHQQQRRQHYVNYLTQSQYVHKTNVYASRLPSPSENCGLTIFNRSISYEI